MTGPAQGLPPALSARLAKTAFAEAFGLDVDAVEEVWHGVAPPSAALFAWAARRMPLSTMGFIQFLAPTLQFLIGVATGEAFTPLRAVSFIFIWLGAGVFALAAVLRGRAARRAMAATTGPV